VGLDFDGLVLKHCMDAFGESVSYDSARSPAPFTITGIFDEAYSEIVLDRGEPLTTLMPVLGVRLAEFPADFPPLQSDQLTLVRTCERFTVREVRIDGHGGVKLMLNAIGG
jgi:hypothetical protein